MYGMKIKYFNLNNVRHYENYQVTFIAQKSASSQEFYFHDYNMYKLAFHSDTILHDGILPS